MFPDVARARSPRSENYTANRRSRQRWTFAFSLLCSINGRCSAHPSGTLRQRPSSISSRKLPQHLFEFQQPQAPTEKKFQELRQSCTGVPLAYAVFAFPRGGGSRRSAVPQTPSQKTRHLAMEVLPSTSMMPSYHRGAPAEPRLDQLSFNPPSPLHVGRSSHRWHGRSYSTSFHHFGAPTILLVTFA